VWGETIGSKDVDYFLLRGHPRSQNSTQPSEEFTTMQYYEDRQRKQPVRRIDQFGTITDY
jgi:hypothetical protein